MRISAFVVGIVGLLTVLVWLESTGPATDPFVPSAPPSVVNLDYLDPYVLNKIKMEHAAARPPFDVAIFSDSRSEQVGTRLVEGLGLSFFSFAVSGEGFRSSVSRLEQLAAMGKAPRVALVQVANFESQEFAPGWSLSLSQRLREMRQDLMRSDAPASVRQAMAKAYAGREMHLVRHIFDAARLKIIITRLLHPPPRQAETPLGAEFGMRSDGSRKAPHRDLPEPMIMLSQPERIALFYFRTDLERLRALAVATGSRIIVYEPPLAANSRRHYAARPSPHAQAARAQFLAVCGGGGSLTCVSQPEDFPGDETHWPDAEHAPEGPLTAWMRLLLLRHGGIGGARP